MAGSFREKKCRCSWFLLGSIAEKRDFVLNEIIADLRSDCWIEAVDD